MQFTLSTAILAAAAFFAPQLANAQACGSEALARQICGANGWPAEPSKFCVTTSAACADTVIDCSADNYGWSECKNCQQVAGASPAQVTCDDE